MTTLLILIAVIAIGELIHGIAVLAYSLSPTYVIRQRLNAYANHDERPYR